MEAEVAKAQLAGIEDATKERQRWERASDQPRRWQSELVVESPE